MKSCVTCTHHVLSTNGEHQCGRTAVVRAGIDLVTGEGKEAISLQSCRVERIGGPIVLMTIRLATGVRLCGREGRYWTSAD